MIRKKCGDDAFINSPIKPASEIVPLAGFGLGVEATVQVGVIYAGHDETTKAFDDGRLAFFIGDDRKQVFISYRG
ncbi:MAG: hypothetical protein K6E27_02775 [Eubacterium sp.]|nr:hypothetical protein [Eubacterium sp.]